MKYVFAVRLERALEDRYVVGSSYGDAQAQMLESGDGVFTIESISQLGPVVGSEEFADEEPA